MEEYTENNVVDLIGIVSETPTFSHEIFGEGFYLLILNVERLSGNIDKIPVLFSERAYDPNEIKGSINILVNGQFRSYNVNSKDGGHKLRLLVFARTIEQIKEKRFSNEIILDGYICKKPIFRTTPFGREITDILFAVNRAYNKSDYLPCVVWGRNAKFCGSLSVGAHAKINGRIQSRGYQKKLKDGMVLKKTAYEVSVNTIEVVE